MKVNFSKPIVNIQTDEPFKTNKGDMLLAHVCVEALLVVDQNDGKTGGEEKLRRYELAKKVSAGGEINIKPEEATLLKDRIGKTYGPAVVGPAFEALNG